MHVVEQAIQVVGALLILAAFVLVQLDRLRPSTWTYLWLNLVGSAILAVDALIGREIGFLSWKACGRRCRSGASSRSHVAPSPTRSDTDRGSGTSRSGAGRRPHSGPPRRSPRPIGIRHTMHA